MTRPLVVAVLVWAVGCASPPVPPPVAPLPIDLSPRCLQIEGVPEPLAARAPDPNGAGALVAWEADDDAPGFTVSTPAAGLESTAWGFAPTDPPHPFGLALAAALLREAHTAADPEAFRTRLRRLGGSSVFVEDGWLWLELRHLPEQRDDARALLAEWVATRPVEAERFAWTRRSVALALLAEDASAERVAERAFGRLVAASPGVVVPATEDDGPDPAREWDAEALDAFLHGWLRPEGARRLHSALALPVTMPNAGVAEPSTRGSVEERLPPLVPEPGALYLVDRPGSPQVEILVGHPSVGPTHPDAPALEMLASLLGGNVGGRLFRDLRERQGLAYILNAFQEPEGRFVVSTRARPERVAALLVGIEAHLRALAEEPLLPCEVEDLRRRMAGEEALRSDDPEALRARLRREVAWSGAPRASSERAAAWARVDLDALEAVAQRYLDAAPIVVLVGDADTLEGPLSRALPGRSLHVFDASLSGVD